jgi:hypothetical protein
LLKLALAAALGAALCAGLVPASLAAESASIQSFLNKAGGGGMIANSQTNPDDETWSWEACSVDLVTCKPFAQGRIVHTAGTPTPSVFKAISSYGATTLSPRWNGRASAVSPPTVSGTVRAGEIVLPLPGRWRGGWDGDYDWTQLAACRGPEDEGCTTLTDMHYIDGCRNGATVIDPKFTGMYLRVADQRVAATSGILDYGRETPYGPYIWPESPTVSVAMVGRIAPAKGPAATECGPPLVEASISRRGVATVRCEETCRATLVARQGKRQARASRKVAFRKRDATAPSLRLRSTQLREFKSGAIHYLLKVDGWRVASRTLNREVP